MARVADIAGFIIQESDRISNLKLQKLLYYAQGWHLGLMGKELFSEPLEAWVHGPVQPGMFHQYKLFGWRDIAKPTTPVSLTVSAEKHMREVLKAYGKYTGDQLERLSHSEEPWLQARNGLRSDEPSRNVITTESMREFFAAKANA